MALPITTRPSFPLIQSLPSGSFHRPLILIHQRADRMKTNSQDYSNWSRGSQPCPTQWNYEPCPEGPPKKDGSWWRVLTKTWSTGEGSGKPLQYYCLENLMNSMQRQKDRTLKDELPRLVGAQYAIGEQWRNNSRKNEETELKQTQHPIVDVTCDRSKVWCCKEQYCIGTWNVRSMNQGKLEVVKQVVERVNISILGISELKWTGMGEFNSDDCYIYYCGQESLRRNGVALLVIKRVWNAVLGCSLKNDRMISVHFQGKLFNVQVYAMTSNAEEAEVEDLWRPTRPSRTTTQKKMSFSLLETRMQK